MNVCKAYPSIREVLVQPHSSALPATTVIKPGKGSALSSAWVAKVQAQLASSGCVGVRVMARSAWAQEQIGAAMGPSNDRELECAAQQVLTFDAAELFPRSSQAKQVVLLHYQSTGSGTSAAANAGATTAAPATALQHPQHGQDQPSEPVPAGLQQLPPDMQHIICSQLGPQDVQHLCRAARWWHTYMAEHACAMRLVLGSDMDHAAAAAKVTFGGAFALAPTSSASGAQQPHVGSAMTVQLAQQQHAEAAGDGTPPEPVASVLPLATLAQPVQAISQAPRPLRLTLVNDGSAAGSLAMFLVNSAATSGSVRDAATELVLEVSLYHICIRFPWRLLALRMHSCGMQA